MPGAARRDRTPVVIRMSKVGLALVDSMAKGERVSRSEMVRRLVADGIRFRGKAGAAMVTKDVAPRAPAGSAFEDWPAEPVPRSVHDDPDVPAVVDAAGEVFPDDDWTA